MIKSLKNTNYNIFKFQTKKPNIIKMHPIKSSNITKKIKTGGCTFGGASAIRNEEDILRMMRYFFNHKNKNEHKSYGIRNYALICWGFNTALRGGDLLSLKLSDIINKDTNEFLDEFIISEQKTKKPKIVFVNSEMKKALIIYFEKEKRCKNNFNEPLFCSRESINGELKSISLRRYNQLLKEAKSELSLSGKISTHTCRKSFARGIYDATPDDEKQHILVLISAMLNHSNIETTMCYLDIRKDELRNIVYSRQIGIL